MCPPTGNRITPKRNRTHKIKRRILLVPCQLCFFVRTQSPAQSYRGLRNVYEGQHGAQEINVRNKSQHDQCGNVTIKRNTKEGSSRKNRPGTQVPNGQCSEIANRRRKAVMPASQIETGANSKAQHVHNKRKENLK